MGSRHAKAYSIVMCESLRQKTRTESEETLSVVNIENLIIRERETEKRPEEPVT